MLCRGEGDIGDKTLSNFRASAGPKLGNLDIWRMKVTLTNTNGIKGRVYASKLERFKTRPASPDALQHIMFH